MTAHLILIAVVVGLGGFMQGFAGFGLVLIVVPLLSTMIDVKMAIPIAGVFSWLVSVPLVLKMHRHVQWQAVGFLVIGAFPGAFIGADLLKHLSASVILMALGLILIMSSLYALSGYQQRLGHNSKWLTCSIGFVSGVLGSGVGASGPPVIAYTSMLPWHSHEIKATLVAFFMLQMIGAMLSFWTKGLLTPEVSFYVLKALPGFVIGVVGGVFIYQLLHRYNMNFRKIIHFILLLMGVMLVAKNFMQLTL